MTCGIMQSSCSAVRIFNQGGAHFFPSHPNSSMRATPVEHQLDTLCSCVRPLNGALSLRRRPCRAADRSVHGGDGHQLRGGCDAR